MVQKFIDQAKHNENFHASIENSFPLEFFDWKCVVLYYAALFYMKAYLVHKGYASGNSHEEVLFAINPYKNTPNQKRPIVSHHCFNAFKKLHRKSMQSRYEFGFFIDTNTAQQEQHRQHLEDLVYIKKYLKGQHNLPI